MCITCLSHVILYFIAANGAGQFCSGFWRVNTMTSYLKRAQSARPKKRKFHGNQYVYDTEEDENADVSASSRKLSETSSDDITISPLHYYRISFNV